MGHFVFIWCAVHTSLHFNYSIWYGDPKWRSENSISRSETKILNAKYKPLPLSFSPLPTWEMYKLYNNFQICLLWICIRNHKYPVKNFIRDWFLWQVCTRVSEQNSNESQLMQFWKTPSSAVTVNGGLLAICLTFLNAWKQMFSVGRHFSEKRVHAYFTCSKFSEVGKS